MIDDRTKMVSLRSSQAPARIAVQQSFIKGWKILTVAD
jgi:hypothetical protein